MRKILSKKEWAISHGFIFVGLICLSIAIFLSYETPVSNLFVFGLWFSLGGICYVAVYLARRLKECQVAQARR